MAAWLLVVIASSESKIPDASVATRAQSSCEALTLFDPE
jgi:hypothetical protein